MDSEKDHNFLLQWVLVDCLVAERANSLLESPGIPIFKTQNPPPPRQKKIPDNPHSVKCLFYHALTLTPFIGISYNDMVSLL